MDVSVPDDASNALLVRPIADADLQLFALAKRFMQKYRLAEALYCDRCAEAGRFSGTHAAKVRQSGLTIEVTIDCRCSHRYGRGSGLH